MVDHIKICEGLSEISDSYNGFLIDQWGTLHDGNKPFPDVLEALKNLKSRGKQIIFISNSGKRSNVYHDRLMKMGFEDDLFDHILTSAEVMWQNLHSNQEVGVFKEIGNDCFLLNRKGGLSGIDDIDTVNIVETIEEASFILLTGSDAPEKTLDNYYDDILKEASRKQIKMICANPEKIMTINNEKFMGSGEIAQRYEEFGGVVHYIGKPFPSLFEHALTLFDDLYRSQICVIGDSLSNDMRAAQYLDMDCALIANGVHKGSFNKVKSRADIHKMLKILGKNHGVEPTYFIPKFHWGKPLPDRKNKIRNK